MKNKIVAIILFSILFMIASCKKDSTKYTTPPVITLKAPIQQIWKPDSTPYIDPGYSASDQIDGDLTKAVVITGTVTTTKQDTYKLYYNVKDKGGLSAIQKTRTVIVAYE